jgi:hypothetical protein
LENGAKWQYSSEKYLLTIYAGKIKLRSEQMMTKLENLIAQAPI